MSVVLLNGCIAFNRYSADIIMEMGESAKLTQALASVSGFLCCIFGVGYGLMLCASHTGYNISRTHNEGYVCPAHICRLESSG